MAPNLFYTIFIYNLIILLFKKGVDYIGKTIFRF